MAMATTPGSSGFASVESVTPLRATPAPFEGQPHSAARTVHMEYAYEQAEGQSVGRWVTKLIEFLRATTARSAGNSNPGERTEPTASRHLDTTLPTTDPAASFSNYVFYKNAAAASPSSYVICKNATSIDVLSTGGVSATSTTAGVKETFDSSTEEVAFSGAGAENEGPLAGGSTFASADAGAKFDFVLGGASRSSTATS